MAKAARSEKGMRQHGAVESKREQETDWGMERVRELRGIPGVQQVL